MKRTAQVTQEHAEETGSNHFTSMAMKTPLIAIAGLAILTVFLSVAPSQDLLANVSGLLCMAAFLLPAFIVLGFLAISSADIEQDGLRINYVFRASTSILWQDISEVRVRTSNVGVTLLEIKSVNKPYLTERIPIDNPKLLGGVNKKARDFVAAVAQRAKLTQQSTTRHGSIIYRRG
jgi:hypothetical protein